MDRKQQVMIDIDNLEASPLNSFDADNIEDMIGSLKSLGLLTPLSVIGPTKDGKYQVLSGERRFKGITEIRKENTNFYSQVPCYIVGGEDMDVLEQKLIIESANLETREFDKDEHRFNIIAILKQMQDEGKLGHRSLIDELGKYMSGSPRYRRMYQTIFNSGTKETKELLKNKELAVHEAAKVSKLDEETQKTVADVIHAGVDKKDVLDTITRINTEKREEKEKNPDLINSNEMGEISRIAEEYEESFDKEFGEDEEGIEGLFDKAVSKDDFYKKLDNGEYAREELLKLIDNRPDYGLEYDTTGMLASIKDGSSGRKDNTVNQIQKWCKMMLNKKTISDEERELVEPLEDVIEHIKLAYDTQE